MDQKILQHILWILQKNISRLMQIIEVKRLIFSLELLFIIYDKVQIDLQNL